MESTNPPHRGDDGPKPVWARNDGGEAARSIQHHDNAYAIGTVDFTGDLPVLRGPDGPSLGGFVCPATIVSAELWKLGQLKSGDIVRFQRLTLAQAEQMDLDLEQCIANLNGPLPSLPNAALLEPAVIHQSDAAVYRASGDKYLLIEYGPNVLDLELRFRVHALETLLRKTNVPGIVDITPGIRSLQIHYDNRLLPRTEILRTIDALDAALPEPDEISVPTRIVHLPLSWDDPATQLAIRKYMQSVRPDAPWCPSNIEFIRRINGLDSIQDVSHGFRRQLSRSWPGRCLPRCAGCNAGRPGIVW
ncbi:MAG: carboxyltransferase domain-containing protein [Bryobacteraceae bacterium]